MTTYFIAAPGGVIEGPPPVAPLERIPQLTLESMNGRYSIVLDGTQGWIRMPGATGLDMPPIEVISESQPDVDGATVKEVRVLPRPVFLPIYCGSGTTNVQFREMKNNLRKIIDPKTGAFRIVGSSENTERELVVTYTGGLEGSDELGREGLTWGKIGLNATAYQPFAQGRADRTLEFRTSSTARPFLGQVGGTDAPWPPSLVSSAVIGDNMEVYINSDVPVWPTLKMTGPMTSFEGNLSPVITYPDGSTAVLDGEEWYIDIPLGVPSTQVFSLVTDPTRYTARLNGVLAAGRISLGSTLRQFHPGLNVLNVTAPGSTSATRVEISWRELYWSLF